LGGAEYEIGIKAPQQKPLTRHYVTPSPLRARGKLVMKPTKCA